MCVWVCATVGNSARDGVFAYVNNCVNVGVIVCVVCVSVFDGVDVVISPTALRMRVCGCLCACV